MGQGHLPRLMWPKEKMQPSAPLTTDWSTSATVPEQTSAWGGTENQAGARAQGLWPLPSATSVGLRRQPTRRLGCTPGTKDRSHVHTESTEHTRTGPRTHAGGTGQTRADTHPQSTEVRLPRADHHAWRDAHAATRSTAQHEQGAPGAPRAQSSTAAQKTSPEGGLRKTRPFPVHLAQSLSRGRWRHPRTLARWMREVSRQAPQAAGPPCSLFLCTRHGKAGADLTHVLSQQPGSGPPGGRPVRLPVPARSPGGRRHRRQTSWELQQWRLAGGLRCLGDRRWDHRGSPASSEGPPSGRTWPRPSAGPPVRARSEA